MSSSERENEETMKIPHAFAVRNLIYVMVCKDRILDMLLELLVNTCQTPANNIERLSSGYSGILKVHLVCVCVCVLVMKN